MSGGKGATLAVSCFNKDENRDLWENVRYQFGNRWERLWVISYHLMRLGTLMGEIESNDLKGSFFRRPMRMKPNENIISSE